VLLNEEPDRTLSLLPLDLITITLVKRDTLIWWTFMNILLKFRFVHKHFNSVAAKIKW